MKVTEADIQAGQAIYTPFIPKWYNFWVLDICNRWVWRCPTHYQLAQFDRFISANHLDIGVGTGFYLQHCRRPDSLQLSLLDLNPFCLATASKAVKPLSPTLYQADILKPQPHLLEHFDYHSLNFLLHCLPGDMSNKSRALTNAIAMLKPNGVLFGATVLSDAHLHDLISRPLLYFYNYRKIYSNYDDTQAALTEALTAHLQEVEVTIQGCVALFHGIKKA